MHSVDYCTVIVLPFEDVYPVAACNALINLNLNSLGYATITPEMINEDSYDNCLIDTMYITIDGKDTNIADCSDKNDSLKVRLHVQDVSGNKNVCWGYVIIEDKIGLKKKVPK